MVKKIAALALAAVCLCSCSMKKPEIIRSVNQYETDYSTVEAETVQLANLDDKEFEAAFNENIAKASESAVVAFDTKAADSSSDIRMGNKCVFETKWDEKYNDNDFISLVEESYIYMGGAHGETVRLPRNIDLAASKEIRLADLFADDDYASTLNRMINELIEENEEEYEDLWEKPGIKESHQTDFYIEDDKLVIFFQPYDLSYYARGFVEFPLDLEDLSGYMKEEYRRLIEG